MSTPCYAEANAGLQHELARIRRNVGLREARETRKRKRSSHHTDPHTILSLQESAEQAQGQAKIRAGASAPQAGEHDQSVTSALMQLPAELRNLIYEDALVYDNTSRPAMAPHLLRTCRQIHREAQAILNGNMKSIALIQINSSTTKATLISHDRDYPTEVQEVTSLDTAFKQSWASILGDRRHAIVDVHLDGTDPGSKLQATYPLVNRQLYLLATALVTSNVDTLDFYLKISNQLHTDIHYDICLWPLSRIPHCIKATLHGLPPTTPHHSDLDIHHPGLDIHHPDLDIHHPDLDIYHPDLDIYHPDLDIYHPDLGVSPRRRNDTTALALWLRAHEDLDTFAQRIERAGIEDRRVRDYLYSMEAGSKVERSVTHMEHNVELSLADTAIEAQETLWSPDWQELNQRALQTLREDEHVGLGGRHIFEMKHTEGGLGLVRKE